MRLLLIMLVPIALLPLLFLAGCSGTSEPDEFGAVAGVISIADGSQFIVGAVVSCAGESDTSDAQGAYNLSHVPSGIQQLTVTYRGYQPHSAILQIAEQTTHNVALMPASYKNLIENGSFELADEQSLEGWEVTEHLIEFSSDTPPNGGQWSLSLEPGWIPDEGFAQAAITGFDGNGVFRLIFWTRSPSSWQGIGQLWRTGSWGLTRIITYHFDQPQWQRIILEMDCEVAPDDTFHVKLSAGSTEVASGEVLFDLVRFEKLE